MKKTILASAAFLLTLHNTGQIDRQPQISPVLMGQSYHYSQFLGADQNYPNTLNDFSNFSASTWTKIAESQARFIRIGGNSYNTGERNGFDAKPPSDRLFYYVEMIDECRRNNC